MSDPRNDRAPSAVRAGGEVGCLPPGYRLHEFVIDSVLGEGGFGVVYAATDTRLERRVAIKEYMPTSLATRDIDFSVHARSSADHREAFVAGLRSFVNEAKLLARFEHPSLVRVYQFWEERGTAYMVMPLYSAPTFKRWIKLRTKPVEEGWLVGFLDAVIDALDVLHRENCLHRDVAPDNILVLNDATPMLLDFGAARRVIGDLTHNLTVILKPGFAPVEQYAETSALKQGTWTDVYALSAVGYFAITGKAPVAAVGRMVSDELVPLRELAAGRYSQRLLAALDAGLRVRPEDRPLSMQALRAYLFGDAMVDDKTTVIMSKGPTPAAPLSPAPAALHSTFKPTATPPAADVDATRVMTDTPAKVAPPTISPSAAPTFKLPPQPPKPASPAFAAGAAQPAPPSRRSGALLWAGSFAAGGAAIVLGAAWWLNRTPAPVQPPAVAQQAPVQAPVVDVQPTPVPVTPAPIPAPSPAPAPIQAAPAPTPAPVKPSVKPSPPPVVAKATPTPAPPRVVEKKSPPPAPAASKPAPPPAEPPRIAEAPKVEPAPPPALRAPEGPPPLAVSDTGITPLQVEGTVNPKDKEPHFAAYTCCNLHYSGDWVSDLNYSSDTRIPAGAPIKIVDYGRWRLITEVDGKKVRIGLDYGRRQETLAQFARKLTVDKDLRFRIASFPPVVQDAIRAGKVLPGMSKEQVVIAVGFPARHETPSVDGSEWKLWHTSRIPYTVRFDERGRVKEIEIDPEQRAKVVYGVVKQNP
jgi:hypothetical protein